MASVAAAMIDLVFIGILLKFLRLEFERQEGNARRAVKGSGRCAGFAQQSEVCSRQGTQAGGGQGVNLWLAAVPSRDRDTGGRDTVLLACFAPRCADPIPRTEGDKDMAKSIEA